MATASHRSAFSYSITRPYPFRWFTPAVIALWVAATALFSFLNFASSGYDLIVHTTANPNDTVADGSLWFRRLPAYLTSKVQPRCQSADIRVNTQLFTNQTALTYTLTGVGLLGREDETVLPSLMYFNNPLGDCAVSSVEIDLNALDRTGSQIGFAEWGATVRSFVACTVDTEAGPASINLTSVYDYVPDTLSLSELPIFLGTNFLTRDKEAKASLYWGESLMSMYYVYLTRSMQDIRVNETQSGQPGIRMGTIAFRMNTDHSSSSSDISNLGFFEVDYRLIVDRGGGDFDTIHPGLYHNAYSVGALDEQQAYPNVWIQADSLAKSMYSTILTDLGQVSASPHILNDAATLQHFTSNFSLALEHKANAQPGPAQQDYNTLKDTIGPLGITPSVFTTNYICQIPQLKSAGSLFLTVLIADLVFLQTLWKVFILITDWWMFRRHPSANRCLGCGDERSNQSRFVGGEPGGSKGFQYSVIEQRDSPDTAVSTDVQYSPVRRKPLGL